MAQEDRFANIYSAELTLSAANTLTTLELNFGIQLRDKMAIVIDQIFYQPTPPTILEMTASGDNVVIALVNSDQVSDLTDYNDRRIVAMKLLMRMDFGTAAGGQLFQMPMLEEYSPPIIVLPTRLYLAGNTNGLASAAVLRVRIHFRTTGITSEQQLQEVLESYQLTT